MRKLLLVLVLNIRRGEKCRLRRDANIHQLSFKLTMHKRRLILSFCVFEYRDEQLNRTSKSFHRDGTDSEVNAAKSTATGNKSMNKS